MAARGQISVLEDQLKQTKAQAGAALKRAEAADAKAAEQDVQAAGELAAAEERVRMADSMSKVGQRAWQHVDLFAPYRRQVQLMPD